MFVSIVALGLAGQPSLGQDDRWVRVASARGGAVWYADLERTRLIDGTLSLWIRVDHTNDRSTRYRSSISHYQIDCQLMTYRAGTVVAYFPDGRSDRSEGQSQYEAAQDLIPGTTLEATASRMCSAQPESE